MGFIDPECEARYLLRDVHTLSARAIVAHHGLTVLVVPGLKAEACFATIHGRPTICLRGKLPAVALRWALLHELAEWHLARLEYRGEDVETVAEAITAALVAPRDVYQRAHAEHGTDFQALGEAFAATQTAMALRLGEVTGRPVLVVTPAAVRVRGEPWGWPSVDECRRLAKNDRPGLVRVGLGERKRTAILAA